MLLLQQYDLVKSARKALLGYCATIAPDDFLQEHPSFGRGSIRNLLVHNLNTYQWWIGTHALQRDVEFTSYDSGGDLAQVVSLFEQVDDMMADFFSRFEQNPLEEVWASLGEKRFATTPLALFTHAVTHEFHHKGQILSLSRHLGYVPIDTDIIR